MIQTLIQKYKLQKYIKDIDASLPTVLSEKRGLLTDIFEEETIGIEKNAREEAIATVLQTIYPTIKPSFLSMEHPDHYNLKEHGFKAVLPRFAVYSLDSPRCIVALAIEAVNYGYLGSDGSDVTCLGQIIKEPQLPNELSNPITDAISITGMNPKCGIPHPFHGEITFSSQFKGNIPQEVKEEIKLARRAFGKELYIIAEANRWERGEDKILSPKRTGDPLVVGVIDQQCFLVSEFNCTPLEDYGRRERVLN